MKVVIVGTGNVATVLGIKILQAGNIIVQVVGRDFEKTNILASSLSSTAVYNVRDINASADIYLIAVADSAIPTVASSIKLKGNIIVHTAASVSKDVLNNSSENHGVIYPLQTLKKQLKIIPPIPVLCDGSNERTIAAIKNFSEQWADSVMIANDEERVKLHVAAVFVNNFSNHLFAVAQKYCEREQLNFNLLLPLIEETIERIRVNKPSDVQTGPAIRSDILTIKKHELLLASYPQYLELYKMMTDSIIRSYTQGNALEL